MGELTFLPEMTNSFEEFEPDEDWSVISCNNYLFYDKLSSLILLTVSATIFTLFFINVMRLKLGRNIKFLLWVLEISYVAQTVIQWIFKIVEMNVGGLDHEHGGDTDSSSESSHVNDAHYKHFHEAENVAYYLTFYLNMSIFYYYGFTMKKTQIYLDCDDDEAVDEV